MAIATAINAGVITPIDARGSVSDAQPSLTPSLPATQPDTVPTLSPPSLTLPDISQMEAQLKTQGSLLSEITVQPNPASTPLQHLQPNLIQMPSTPEPSASPVIPLVPITLASTAPATQPTAQPTIPIKKTASTPSLPEEQNLLKPILKISALISLLVLGAMGFMMWQTNPLSQASTTEPTAAQPLWSGWFTQFTTSDGTSNTINIDQESSTFKWYQSP